MAAAKKQKKSYQSLFYVKTSLNDLIEDLDSWVSPNGQVFAGNSDVLRLVKNSRIWD
jgi:2-succinyl-5-enolpyruvyl-6-hydroxy-3-cyclohexene-1-carboxylate synthase